jgi:TatD DNase family protein
MYIGITGWVCDERRGAELQEIVKYIPPDRLLIETDAPYLLPRTLRPKPKSRRNEPCHLVEVVRMLAQCTGREAEQIAEESTRNAHRLFGLPIDNTGT